MPQQVYVLSLPEASQVRVVWHENQEQEDEWEDIIVYLDQTILGRIPTQQELTAGHDFTLPDSSVLKVQLFGGQLELRRNGEVLAPLPGSITVRHSRPTVISKWGFGCVYTLLGVGIIGLGIPLFLFIGFVVQDANLQWNSMQAQGTIVGVQSVQCQYKTSSYGHNYRAGYNYAVKFTDQAGQVHLATLYGCSIAVPVTPSFTIVYPANDPENISLPNTTRSFGLDLFLAILIALLELGCIGLGIKLIRDQRRGKIKVQLLYSGS